MSGHSKWANIKRTKGVNDVKRAQIFTKLARAVTMAARKAGGDPNSNPFLRKAVDDARAQNMPKDNIERAIAKGTGSGEGMLLEELTLEGYGPSGVAFLIEAVTDNRNRTLSEVRGVFSRSGGNLGQPGSAAYIFGADPANPSFTVPLSDENEARRVLAMSEALEDLDDVHKVFANFDIEESILNKLAGEN
ncbi:MAG: YebC/PmpR family DNA-binding transcriptional regulator [Patescibacteria group bacterium]|nr:YebC/PmpR family DNA-binding transcriptional regulator [Patescibacteria group bacterium]